MGTHFHIVPFILSSAEENDDLKMAFMHFFIAFLALGVVAAEEEFIEGLSAEDILNTEFEVEYAEDDRTIDEIIAAAGTAEGAAKAAGENQEINYDMDMNMDPMQYSLEYGNLAGFAGAGMANGWYRWPKAIIPYKIQRGYTQSQLNVIYQGMQMWMRKTCIKFVPAGSADARSTGHNNYITIFSGGGCYSSVGYNHRSHQVSLAARGCTLPGIVAHELGHTIGLHHEQCRPDRDNYLKIFLSNVPSNMRHNFNKVQGTSNFGMPYDYCSLMHYGATAFGGRHFTIVPKDLDYLAVIGRSHNRAADLTYTDVTIVNKMYGCNIQAQQTPCPKIPCTSRYSAATCNSLRG